MMMKESFSGGFSGMPKIKKPKLPLKAKLSMSGKLRSFIGKGAFSKSSTSTKPSNGTIGKVKEYKFKSKIV